MALVIRRDLVWDYDIPEDPERNEGFLALYVGRVLERGTAADVHGLSLERIRRYLDVAPVRAEVRDFWRWFFDWEVGHDDPHRRPAHIPVHRGIGGDPPP